MSDENENGAPAILTPREVAQIARMRLKTVYDLLDAGDMPGRRIGTRWRIPADALMRWLGDRDAEPEAAAR